MASNSSDGVSILDLMCKDRHKDAQVHKDARDSYNKEAKLWAERCNEYNQMAKDSSAKATEAKKERDQFNAQVKEMKAKRNELQTKAAPLKESGCEEYIKLRDEANGIHEQMSVIASKGQLAHAHMEQFLEDANVARKLAGSAHKKSLECRKKANEEHNLYVKSMESIKGMKDNPFSEIPVEGETSE